jgi:hypothetical protein
VSEADFFLGGPIDPRTGSRLDSVTGVDPGDLTTHGVIVGMTGSGKTGLGIIYIEEALRRVIPTLVVDPKSDMTNLLLNFLGLMPQDFEPWMDETEARRENTTTAAMEPQRPSSGRTDSPDGGFRAPTSVNLETLQASLSTRPARRQAYR